MRLIFCIVLVALGGSSLAYHNRSVDNGPNTVHSVLFTYQKGTSRISTSGNIIHSQLSKPKSYKGTITTTIVDGTSGLASIPKEPATDVLQSGWHKKQGDEHPDSSVCFHCPPNRTVIAMRGRSSLIMEPPPMIPCDPWFNPSDGRMTVVRGPRFGHLVYEGTHDILLMITHKDRRIKMCQYKYTVIVQKCNRLIITEGLTAKCTYKESWGSKCTFSCDPGYKVSEHKTIQCNNGLEWSGPPPTCTHFFFYNASELISNNGCPLPVSSENGYLSCWSPEKNPVKVQDGMPDGTTCRYRCNKGYHIPQSQKKLVKLVCLTGNWNTSQDPSCVKIDPNYRNSWNRKSISYKSEKNVRFTPSQCHRGLCRNGGSCYVILGEARCLCKSGYKGPRCAQKIIH